MTSSGGDAPDPPTQTGQAQRQGGQTGQDSPARRDTADFARRLDEAFRWLAANKKLGGSRYEAAFAERCKVSVKTIRRWLAGSHLPKRDSWQTACDNLRRAGLDPALLRALDTAWSAENARPSRTENEPTEESEAETQ